MNLVMKSLANLARHFLAYVEEKENDTYIPQQVAPQPTVLARSIQQAKPVLTDEEQWFQLKMPSRQVWISNHGRLKMIGGKGRGGRTRGKEIILQQKARDSEATLNCKIRDEIDGERVSVVISTAKAVLMAFGQEPDWKDEYPLVYSRSTQSYIHKDGNRENCHINNLEWVDSRRAYALNESMMKICKLDDESIYHHLAPFNGDYTYLTSRIKNKLEPVIETAEPVKEVTEAVEEEIWRDVPEFVGFYQVSNLGRVRSMTRYVHRYGAKRPNKEDPQYLTPEALESHDKRMYRIARGVILKPMTVDGVPGVTLCRDGVQMPVPISQVVVEAFYPERKAEGKTYYHEHIDGDIKNNRLDNLRFI